VLLLLASRGTPVQGHRASLVTLALLLLLDVAAVSVLSHLHLIEKIGVVLFGIPCPRAQPVVRHQPPQSASLPL
jgi:hypothetical protein